LNLDGSGAMQRLTHFSDFPGFKGTQGVISDDGRLLCYQIGKRGDEAGVGYGLFLMDLQAAARHLEEPRNLAKSEHPLQILADEYVSAWKKKRPLPQFTQLEAPRKLSLQEAYQVQRCWVKQTLDRSGIGGVKGAVVTPGGQKALAIGEPLGAFLRASGRFEAKDEPTITLANWISMGIETEIGFVIGKTIDTRLETVDDFKKHIRAIVPMIELPAGAWEHKAKPTAADVVAINVNAAAYIVGTEVAPTLLDPGKVTVAFTRDGKELHRATGAECWKGPWETGHWLANFAWRQGIELRPGQVILCGALGKVHPGTPGRYVADYGDLGKIVFQLK
jgi:2-keto-4-pentenoate hydratase